MRDVFYTIVVVWIVMQIYNSFKSSAQRKAANTQYKKDGDVTVNMNSKANKPNADKGGEYVDYEEIKD